MRILLFHILFALLSQQTTFLETEDLKTSKYENEYLKANDKSLKSKEKRQKIFQVFNFSDSHIQKNSQVFNFSASQVQYYESQIRLADSLYKNYLPQYNFDEVKKAVDFFEKSPSRDDSNNSVTWRLSDLNFLHARAHYYHAVGLTECDDVAGACEHYLRALEIMEIELETENLKTSESEKRPKSKDKSLKSKEKREKVSVAEPVEAPSDDVVPSTSSGTACSKTVDSCPLSVDNPQDYEKLRFLALIYNRLGRLFYNENYCELAITKYRKALKYVEMIDEKSFKANVFKELGNSYQLANVPDSALYYYNESSRYNSNLPNKLDIEKSIAKILLYKGEKDSAYVLLKNNLRVIDNGNLKYSYHHTIGNMFYVDKEYDSALYYLETSLDNDIVTKKVAFTTKLSAIYDSLGDYDKRDYYDNFSAKMLLNNANKEIYNKQLQVLYDNYKERKNERERSIAKAKIRKQIIAIGLCVFIIVAFLLTYIKYMHRKQNNKLKSEIDDYVNKIDNYSKDIENQNIIINQKEKLINDYQITNDKKDKIIDKQKKEIDRIRTRLSKKNVNIEAYYASDICKKIVERKDNDFSCLKEDELALLLKSADEHLDNISERLHNSFHRLNKNDIYTICLLILNVKKSNLQYLLGKDRKTIWNRLNKIKRLMNVDENHDLFLYIKDNFLN
ncbi:MAG: hypothetical protein J6R17_00130 [Bacteroidales bacterium]|nr:hypothetical protein [Bacteroidales bacterium]